MQTIPDPKIEVQHLNLFYGAFQALKDVSMGFAANEITALIGPSGCGKSTLLRSLNRMNDLIPGVRVEGRVLLDGQNVYERRTHIEKLRKRVGMVFQRPNPFPLSVYENVVYGLRVHGAPGRRELDAAVEKSLRDVALWDALKDRLDEPGTELSLEQQQRLCIARVVAVAPEVLLMDEPCSALDPIATMKVEDLMRELVQRYTIVIVTHNMQQAARVSTQTGYMLLGDLVEHGPTARIFTRPEDTRTEDYISGRFG